ncbi:MAG: hypothetical protein ABI211_05700 [Vicinamibacterales bacterium]
MRGPHDDQIRKLGGKPGQNASDHARERLDEFIRERTAADTDGDNADRPSPPSSPPCEPPHRKSRK